MCQTHITFPHKSPRPFITGFLIHWLHKRGLSFEDSQNIATHVQSRLENQQTIEVKTLKKLVEQEITTLKGRNTFLKLKDPSLVHEEIQVQYSDTTGPFSRAFLARSLIASSIEPNQAYEMAQDIYNLLSEQRSVINHRELYHLVFQKIADEYGDESALRYQTADEIKRLQKPLLIYIGGTVGIGKSTLAAELASRLNISHITGTDTIRQIMRIMFTEKILPSLHMSAFEAEYDNAWAMKLDHSLLAGYLDQASKVTVGVRAVAERAIRENCSNIIEGVHLLPALMQFAELQNDAYHIPLVVYLKDEQIHHSRFEIRERRASRRPSRRYFKQFQMIRQINGYFIDQAKKFHIPTIECGSFDETCLNMTKIVISKLQKQRKELAQQKDQGVAMDC